jgi:ABC-2 type transport system ATP-binding protein
MDKKNSVVEVAHVSKTFIRNAGSNSLKTLFTSFLRSGKSQSKHFRILKNTNLTVGEGEFLGIVGRNGSGKSTLLKIIAGIYQPTAGQVTVRGRLVPFIELGVGFNPELSGRDNVYLNGALLGFSKKEIDARYDDIVSFAELDGFMDEKLKNYSSGMQVRLAFSLAIRADADILLIDEVLAVGDANFQKKCYDYFFELKRLKKTVIFISHDMTAIKTYCDRAIVLDDGKVIFDGLVDSATERYVRLFQVDEDVRRAKLERWGDGRAKITGISVRSLKEENIITATVTVLADVQHLSIGFAMKDAATDEIVCGNNSDGSPQVTTPVAAGAKFKVSWHVPHIFRDGSYTIDLAVHGKNGVPVYEWLHNATTIDYKNDNASPYVVSPIGAKPIITVVQ